MLVIPLHEDKEAAEDFLKSRRNQKERKLEIERN